MDGSTFLARDLTISTELVATSAFNGKYDKTGGEISGDVVLVSGDFVQNDGSYCGGKSSVALGEHSFAHGDQVSSLGNGAYAVGLSTIAGMQGWYYEFVDFSTGTFYLTDTQPDLTATPTTGTPPEVDLSFNSGFVVGDKISYVNHSKHDLAGTVSEVIGSKIVVGPLNDSRVVETDVKPDDWSIFAPENPLAGGIWFGSASFAEGYQTKAANEYSHAEGRDTLAFGQYSHAEGRETKAGYASHAEGKNVKVFGQYSHGEGLDTTANGNYAHVEGYGSIANGGASHAEGRQISALGQYSHAEGYLSKASKQSSHAEGEETAAGGLASHAEGHQSEAAGEASHAEGCETVASGKYSHAEGNQAKSFGENSHAEGYLTTSFGKQSHAEGEAARPPSSFTFSGEANAVIYSTFSKTTGESAAHDLAVDDIVNYGSVFAKVIEVPTLVTFKTNTTLSDTAVNKQTLTLVKGAAFGRNSHAEGYYTTAIGAASHAAGTYAVSRDDRSWTWQGKNVSNKYLSHGDGTFNINPDGGADGFYIGDQSLSSMLSSMATQEWVEQQIGSLNEALEEIVG